MSVDVAEVHCGVRMTEMDPLWALEAAVESVRKSQKLHGWKPLGPPVVTIGPDWAEVDVPCTNPMGWRPRHGGD